MEITYYNHSFALLGSFAAILTLIVRHKNKIDSGKLKSKMIDYFKTEWDDLLYLIIIAQLLVFVQEYLFSAWFQYKEIENGWELYYDNEELISFAVGLFGNILFSKIFNLGKSKIDENGV